MTDEKTTLEGLTIDASDLDGLREAIEQAFHYRGDVTVRCTDGREIVGYLYDRQSGQRLEDSKLRMMPADGSPRVTITYHDVAELRFSGRDTAAGRSFETWMKKYVRKKLAGEEASIQSEPLEEG